MPSSALSPAVGVRRPVWLLAAAVTVAYAVTLGLVAPFAGAAFSLVTQLLYAAPGIALVRRVSTTDDGWMPALAIGPLLGVATTNLALLGFWAAGGRGPWLLVAAPAAAALLCWPAARLRGRWQWPLPRPGDAHALLLVLVLGPLLFARPFSQVGTVLPEGRAYRAYFTADFVWQRAVVAELAKGDFLPANPFFVNDVLHYYWLPHLPSAVEYRAVGSTIDLDGLLLGQHVMVGAGFLAVLFGFTRMFVGRPWAAAGAVWWIVVCSSFEGAAAIWSDWRAGRPWSQLSLLNIDALTRWWFDGLPIDGLQRTLWYHPHHELAMAAALVGLLAVVRRRSVRDPAALAVGASLLGLGLILSSFTALVAILATGLIELVGLARRRQWLTILEHAAAASLPLALFAALVTALSYVDYSQDGTGPFMLGLNPLAANRPLTDLALSFGPVLLPSVAGAWLAWRRGWTGTAPLAALLLVCVAFYFFVDIRDAQDVYVAFRVGAFIFIALAPFVASALVGVSELRRGRWLGVAALAAIALAAVPTVAIDWFNVQDVRNRNMGPGFRWTLILTPDEEAGLTWLRRTTPDSARVQVDPMARGADTWAYVPAFAERRMAAGLPISMTPLLKYQEASRRLQLLFDAETEEAYRLAERVGIDYVVIGGQEREAHPGVEDRYRRATSRFEEVFRNEAMAIYRVRHADAGR